MSDKTCGNCHWWRDPVRDHGDCHFNPPTPVVMPARSYQTNYGMRNDEACVTSRLAQTQRDDRCGQWKAKKSWPMISCCMGIFEGDRVTCEGFPGETFVVKTMAPRIDGPASLVIEANGRTEIVCATKCRRIEAGA